MSVNGHRLLAHVVRENASKRRALLPSTRCMLRNNNEIASANDHRSDDCSTNVVERLHDVRLGGTGYGLQPIFQRGRTRSADALPDSKSEKVVSKGHIDGHKDGRRFYASHNAAERRSLRDWAERR